MKKTARILVFVICMTMIFSTCVFAEDHIETVPAETSEESIVPGETDSAPVLLAEKSDNTDREVTEETETRDDSENEEEEPALEEGGETGETKAPVEDSENEEEPAEKPVSEEPADEDLQTDPETEETDPEETVTDEDPEEDAVPEEIPEEVIPEEGEKEAEEPKEDASDDSKTDTEKQSEKIKSDEETEAKIKKAAAISGSISVAVKNANIGRYTFALKGLEKEKSVKAVNFAVWCAADQSDLKWYTGNKKDDGTYRMTMYKYLHQDHTGTYQVHAYADLSDGSSVFIAGKTFVVNNPATTFTVTKNSEQYHFEANYIPRASEISTVKFAVWSKSGGKDDLCWYKASFFSKKTVKAYKDLKLTNHKEAGLYYAEAYGFTASGESIMLGSRISFNVTKKGVLSCSGIKASVNKNTGAFTVTVTDVHSPKAIKNVKIAIWSKSNQSDLIWYTATDKGNGKYVVGTKISKHNYNLGAYKAHVYVYDKKDNGKFLIGKTFNIKASAGTLKIGKNTNERKYPVTIKSVVVPAGAKGVQFAVWSDAGGQDDLVWYSAKETSTAGTYKATIDILNHRTAGVYNVHAYGITKSGANAILGATTFSVVPSATVKIKKTGLNDGNGKFNAVASFENASSPVVSVKMRVWCKSDLSDLYWYKTAQNKNGAFVAAINTMNHYGNRGTYHIEVYASFANGIEMNVANITQWFKPEAYLKVAKSSGTCKRKITYYNSDVSSVKFHVSTQRGGDADKKIYTGKKSSDGVFYATVNMDHFTYDGQYNVKVYSGSTLLDSGSFIMLDYLEEGYKMTKNNKIGYSQIYRCLNPDVDCSSFVYYSLKNTGYNVPDGWPMTTYSEASVLQGAGFTMLAYTNVSDLQPGDILLRTEHTEIYAGNGKTVGAHLDENGDIYGAKSGDQTKKEVCEATLEENWIYAFRYIDYPM